ncbi:hypothetical protein HDR58_07855, partial [bacterium]|nr:hypothetical protein [bacterium]
ANLLIAHSLKTFNQYKHLKGHYGDTSENYILDFATFPGSILLTKNAKKNTEYLYRGRLFSNDYIIPKGVIKIENNDYTQLIEAANNAKGFAKGKVKSDTNLGFNEQDLETRFSEITEKLRNNEIERLFIIGINTYSEVQKEYFRNLLSKLNKNEFAISFSNESEKNNILTINIGEYQPLAIYILHKLFKKYSISEDKIYFFFTKCDVMSISNIIAIKNYKAQNIFMADCSPTLINPSVLNTFKNTYKINVTDNALNDLEKIRHK